MRKKTKYYLLHSLSLSVLLAFFIYLSFYLEILELDNLKTELINKTGSLLVIFVSIYGIFLSIKTKKEQKILYSLISGFYLLYIVTSIEILEAFYKIPIFLDTIEDLGLSIGLLSICMGLYLWIKERDKDYKLIKDSLEQKNFLIKETHHRIKNNLSILSSLINIQTMKMNDDKNIKIFKSFSNRIKSIAFLHNMLYESKNFKSINIKKYIKEIIDNLMQSISSKNIKIYLDIDEIYFDADTAIPIGLITTELVTNALKYGFKDKDSGKIKVKLKKNNSDYYFAISNKGVPFNGSSDFENPETLGFQIVKSLASQISGNLSFKQTGCSKFIINFELPDPAAEK